MMLEGNDEVGMAELGREAGLWTGGVVLSGGGVAFSAA